MINQYAICLYTASSIWNKHSSTKTGIPVLYWSKPPKTKNASGIVFFRVYKVYKIAYWIVNLLIINNLYKNCTVHLTPCFVHLDPYFVHLDLHFVHLDPILYTLYTCTPCNSDTQLPKKGGTCKPVFTTPLTLSWNSTTKCKYE